MQAINANHIKGIDVSHHQRSIDWAAMEATGVRFAYIKATEGVTYRDPKYREHYAGAKAAGILVGFYHYARPYNDPRKEVANLLEATKDLPHDLPFALDIETNEGRFDRAHITDFCVRWLAEIETKTDEKPIVYTYTSFARSYLDKSLAKYPVWIAHYGVKQPGTNGIWDRWSAFQYTSDNDGLPYPGRLDVNVAEVDFVNGKKAKFSDVPANHWAASEIEKAAEDGFLVGFDDGTFRPDEPLTRAQMAVLYQRINAMK